MDKLVEREAGAPAQATAPAIAVQFFLIPLLVVGATVLVYIGFRGLLSEDRSAAEYLTDIRSGGSNRVGSSRVDLQACKLEYSIVSPK